MDSVKEASQALKEASGELESGEGDGVGERPLEQKLRAMDEELAMCEGSFRAALAELEQELTCFCNLMVSVTIAVLEQEPTLGTTAQTRNSHVSVTNE